MTLPNNDTQPTVNTRTTTLEISHADIAVIERRIRQLKELQGAIAQAQRGLNAGLALAEQEFGALETALRRVLEGR